MIRKPVGTLTAVVLAFGVGAVAAPLQATTAVAAAPSGNASAVSLR